MAEIGPIARDQAWVGPELLEVPLQAIADSCLMTAELQTQEVLSTGLCLLSKTRVSKQTTIHTTNPLVFIGHPKAANEQCWD